MTRTIIKKGLLFLLLLVALAGCATTKTFTLKNGDLIHAKTFEETASTYIIEEEKTGRRTIIPKGAVVSIK